jgi:hypothetical protein
MPNADTKGDAAAIYRTKKEKVGKQRRRGQREER